MSLPSWSAAARLSGANLWVTVDAAVSNDLFYFEHNPIRLDNLTIIAPDGSPVKAKVLRNFPVDVSLAQPGTYKIAVVDGLAYACRHSLVARFMRGVRAASRSA